MYKIDRPHADVLLSVEKYLAQKFGHHWHDALIAEENLVVVGQSSSCLVRLVFSLQLFQANNSSDELDVLVVQEILVLSLRIFGEQTHRGGWWGRKRGVREVATRTEKVMLSKIL
jgi:hypothetical protein